MLAQRDVTNNCGAKQNILTKMGFHDDSMNSGVLKRTLHLVIRKME